MKNKLIKILGSLACVLFIQDSILGMNNKQIEICKQEVVHQNGNIKSIIETSKCGFGNNAQIQQNVYNYLPYQKTQNLSKQITVHENNINQIQNEIDRMNGYKSGPRRNAQNQQRQYLCSLFSGEINEQQDTLDNLLAEQE